MSVVEKRDNRPTELKSPPRPRIGSLPGPSFDLPDFSLPEINGDLNTPTYNNLKRSLIHRSQSKRDMDTLAPDDIIEEKTYPSSCPAQFFSLLNSKSNNSSTINNVSSNSRGDGIEVGSLTILSLLEDPVLLPEEDEEEEEGENSRNPLDRKAGRVSSSSAIDEENGSCCDDEDEEDENDDVFLVD